MAVHAGLPAPLDMLLQGMGGQRQRTDADDLVIADGLLGYPGGIFMAQDGDNAPLAQNFKMISWQAIIDALGL